MSFLFGNNDMRVIANDSAVCMEDEGLKEFDEEWFSQRMVLPNPE